MVSTSQYAELQNALYKDFHWGFATAAAQDRFCHTLGKQDVALMKSNSSRLSPLGGANNPVNEQGVQYYNNLIDELIANRITLFYTPNFLHYACLCFERFGDRIKHWITYNEPSVHTLAGYAAGVHALTRSSFRDRNAEGDSLTKTFIVAHTEIVLHACAVKIYRDEFKAQQKGMIGITLHGNYSKPWDVNDLKDVEAAQRAREFEIAWFADLIYSSGEYPASMWAQLGSRLLTFTEEEKELVKSSSDFYSMNTYTTFFVKHRTEEPDINDYKSRGLEVRQTALVGWDQYYVPIYMMENRTTVKGEHVAAPLYLRELVRAVQDGVDIRSYFGWTFTDNWEWAAGYEDREEKTRYAKRSAYFLRDYFGHLIKEK
ncbi:glycoside hydrolase [Lizonia empirigonia]|nr:glycoside hydrolase [Lizonia empirigonia]